MNGQPPSTRAFGVAHDVAHDVAERARAEEALRGARR
jgi:hypothetical protein